MKSFNFLWFDDCGHVRGHLNSWILNYINYYLMNKYFVGILNSWIDMPTKLNVQRIKMISQ